MNKDFQESYLDMGKRILSIRETLNLKQADLAKKIDVVASYLSAIEKGKANPSFQFLSKFNRILNVNMDYIFNGTLPMFRAEKDQQDEEKQYRIDEIKEIESMEQLVWLARRSISFRNALLGWASIYFHQHYNFFKDMLGES